VFRLRIGALALLAALALPLAASAQSAVPPQGSFFQPPQPQQAGARQARRGRRDPYLHALRGLQLSDAQKQQIRGMMRAQRQQLRQQINSVLTDDQRAQLRSQLARTK
jgi:Spy/CpxP family protein refolding chaperone